jgi:hypothetical protein
MAAQSAPSPRRRVGKKQADVWVVVSGGENVDDKMVFEIAVCANGDLDFAVTIDYLRRTSVLSYWPH